MPHFSNIMMLFVILTFFFFSGIYVPMVAEGLGGNEQVEYSDDVTSDAINEAVETAKDNDISAFNIFGIVINILKLAFIGAIDGLPLWIDLSYTLASVIAILFAVVSFVPTIGGGA